MTFDSKRVLIVHRVLKLGVTRKHKYSDKDGYVTQKASMFGGWRLRKSVVYAIDERK